MKHITILIILIMILHLKVYGNNQKWENLYKWGETASGNVWKHNGKKGKNPIYRGDVENGAPNGLGFLIYPDGSSYIGRWKNGLFHGQGKETSNSGKKYIGEWIYGKKDGKGTLIFPSGIKDEGEWNMGKIWKGVSYNKNGSIRHRYVNGEVTTP